MGTPITWMTSGGHELDVWGALPINQFVCNKWVSKILTGEVEYCQSCEPKESWLSLERLMMKSSALFERGPLPPYVHLVSTRHHSRKRYSQAFPIFLCSSTSVYYTEWKLKNKKRGRPGNKATRNVKQVMFQWQLQHRLCDLCCYDNSIQISYKILII